MTPEEMLAERIRPPLDQRGQLLVALLDTEDLVRRYHNQVEFRHAIDLMIRSLPHHVEALAKSADEAIKKEMNGAME